MEITYHLHNRHFSLSKHHIHPHRRVTKMLDEEIISTKLSFRDEMAYLIGISPKLLFLKPRFNFLTEFSLF